MPLYLAPFPEIDFAESAAPSPVELPPAAAGLALVATGGLLAAVGSGTLGGNTLLEFNLAHNDGIDISASSRDCWSLVATGSALVLAGGLTLHFSRDAIGLR